MGQSAQKFDKLAQLFLIVLLLRLNLFDQVQLGHAITVEHLLVDGVNSGVLREQKNCVLLQKCLLEAIPK